MHKPVWPHVFNLKRLNIEESLYSLLPGSLSPDYKYLHAKQIPNQLSFPSQTILDCIRYIIGDYYYNFRSQTKILASY